MAVYKTEDGKQYPAQAYAYVPDPQSPSTWKLRLWESPELKVTRAQLGRAAAALSPGGFRGNRVEIPADDLPKVKAKIRAAYRALGVKDDEIPRWVMSDETVIRPARLLRTGEYPDKQLVITEDDLEAYAAENSGGGIPLKVEHTDTIFDGVLGVVKRVWREGQELLGELEIPKALWELVKSLPSRGLSCGLLKNPHKILEVSLVRAPRVPDAAMLAADTIFVECGELDITEEVEKMAEEQVAATPVEEIGNVATQIREMAAFANPETGKLKEVAETITEAVTATRMSAAAAHKQLAEVVSALQRSQADTLIDEYKRLGKISPAAEPFARAILSQKPIAPRTDGEGVVELSDGTRKHIVDCFIAFLDAMPSRVFGEYPVGDKPTKLSAEQEAFARKLGVDPETVLKYLDR